MTILGKLEQAPRFILEKHQIARVLCQVRFSPILRLREEDAVIAFQEAVRARYPDFQAQRGVALILTPEGVTEQKQPDPLWRFVNSEDHFALVLSPNFVALETSDYVDVDDLCDRLQEAVTLVQEQYAPAKATRIGLRFTNEIRFEVSEIPDRVLEAINPTLLGTAGAPEFSEVVKDTQEVVEIASEVNAFTVRHGLHVGGGTTVEPSDLDSPPDMRPFYLLDLDAHADAETDFSPDATDEQVRLFNEQIRSFFAWAVDEQFRRDVLGQRDL